MILPEPIKKVVEQFAKLPGVGPRQAARFGLHILHSSKQEQEQWVKTIQELQKVKLCPQCNFPSFTKATEGKPTSEDTLCVICADPKRQKTVLAVVERATDVLSLERSGHYKGLYYVLGGNIYTNKNLSVIPLKKRVQDLITEVPPSQIEIILATNPTTEGEATALFIEKEIQPLRVTVSRLGRGLPTGADLEYADAPTLQSALDSRKKQK